MTLELAITYLVGSWLIGFIFGLLIRVLLRNMTEWFT